MFRKLRFILALMMACLMVLAFAPISSANSSSSPFGVMIIFRGDVNFDGYVNSDDALYILKYIRGGFAVHLKRSCPNSRRNRRWNGGY